MSDAPPRPAPDRRALSAGLLLPGAGQALRGDWLSGAAVALATLFFWLAAAIEVVVHNRDGYPAPLALWEALGELSWPLTLVPQLAYAVVCALSVHVGAAWFAQHRGRPHAEGETP